MAVDIINPTDLISTGPAKLNNNFNYLPGYAGTTASITVGASPFTYTAGTTAEVIYISGGAVTSITRNGVAITVALPLTVMLSPGASVVVTYTETPTMVTDQ